MICPVCKATVPPKALARHQAGERCRSAKLTYELYAQNLRPLPITNSLPPFIDRVKPGLTRGVYEGEPRAQLPLVRDPLPQDWVPRWVDVILELWAGPTDRPGAEGVAAKVQRDNVLSVIQTRWTSSMKLALCEAFDREGLRGARELLRPITMGSPPQLIEEFEADLARLRGG